MLKKIFFILLIPQIVAISCKTQEEIQREETIDKAVVQVGENQKLLAQSAIKLQAVEEALAKITGKMDEVQYNNQQTYGQKMTEINGRIDLLEQSNNALSQEMEDQKDYTKKVIKALDKLSTTSPKKSTGGAYQEAVRNYQRGRYKTAKKQFLRLLDKKRVKGAQRARALHNLGMISYMDKSNEQTLVYFSKLYTDYPKSSYNKNGLLVLAKTFQRLGRKDKAKATLEELLSKFPKAKQKKEAQKILAAIAI